jgi:endonuclease YncB( thermonuclease family)
MQNAVAMRKAGVPDSTIAKYLTGVGASMALGMGGVAGAVLFVINLLVEAGAPEDEEEKRRWRELRAKAVEFQQFNNPDGDYVALGVTADGKVPVVDLSFITSFYAQPFVLLKSTIRHLNGEAKDSFFEDVIMKQLPIGLTGDVISSLIVDPAVKFATGQERLPRSDDDGTQVTDIFTYKGIGGAYTDYRRTGNLLTFAGIRAKVVNLPFEMNTLAAASFGKPKSIVEDIKNDIINNATTRYTPEMVRERYGYAIRSTKENARMAESLARFFAKRDGIAVDSDEFIDKYAPGDADFALKTLVEKGAEASVAATYGKALKGMSDTESIRGAVNKAKEKNALVSDDMIAHNLRQAQITIKDIVAPYRTARTTNVRFGEAVDGDTLWATVNGQRYEVRIDNTDTAERDTPLVNGVNYYEVAKARLNTLSRGPKPELEYRVDKNGEMMFDDEGRLLAQPYVNGVNIGNKMVKEKLAYGDSDEIPEFQHPAFAKDKY